MTKIILDIFAVQDFYCRVPNSSLVIADYRWDWWEVCRPLLPCFLVSILMEIVAFGKNLNIRTTRIIIKNPQNYLFLSIMTVIKGEDEQLAGGLCSIPSNQSGCFHSTSFHLSHVGRIVSPQSGWFLSSFH